MDRREVGALFLVWLTACASATPPGRAATGAYDAERAVARYELHVLTPDAGRDEPVEVSKDDFQRALRVMAPDIPLSGPPMEAGRWLMEAGLQADLLAEVDRGRVVRLTPLEDGSPLDAASAAEVTRKYLHMCQQKYGGGDCIGLLTDGPTLTKEDLRALALALALKEVLQETRGALREMVSVQALVGMIVWTGCFYLLLWLLPEPVSKALAAGLTLALLAWLPVDTLWSLMDGWARLVHEVDRATSYEQIEEASERFRRVMGENTARVLVMLVTAALAGSAAKFASKLPKLPGYERAAAWAEAHGFRLAKAGEVEAVAAAEEQTFTLMVRRPGGRAAAAAEEVAEARAGITTIIRFRGGNRLVFYNGQRWHVPANRSIKEIPARDPLGDQLQAAAQRAARDWSPDKLTRQERFAIDQARAAGEHWKANLWERMARGKFVENILRDQFRHLRWSRRGVDAIDPATGYRYEVLSGTRSNMVEHGRRMVEEIFRLITF